MTVREPPTLSLIDSPAADFVRHWASAYRDPTDDRKYTDNILDVDSLEHYDRGRVEQLLEWKSGRFLENARAFAARVDLERLQLFRARSCSRDELQTFWDEHASQLAKSSDSIIWPTFVCHIAHPEAVPIYDVNVWLAWLRMTGQLTEDLLARKPQSFQKYLEYRDFFLQLQSDARSNARTLDKALMAYGQFLSSPVARALGLSATSQPTGVGPSQPVDII